DYEHEGEHNASGANNVFMSSRTKNNALRFQTPWDDRVSVAGLDPPENYACIDSTEAKRIAQDVIQLGRPAVVWNNIEIAGGIWMAVIQCWRNPSFLESERTDRRFHRTRGPQ